MYGDFEIRELPLSLRSVREKVERFLAAQGLRMETLDRYFGVFDREDCLVGGGGLSGGVMKCVAVDSSLRGEQIANTLVSHIQQAAAEEGRQHLMVFTGPCNRRVFGSLGFRLVGEADKALLMETNPRGISGYCRQLSAIAEAGLPGEKRGVIVMNCNPLTLGHRYLLEQAARQVDRLFIIPVIEDASEYSAAERLEMLRGAVADIDNATLCPGSTYSISRATFPTYFLKDLTQAAPTHIQLDLDIFARHIAPALGVSVRFVGSEPTDTLTAAYNDGMKKYLPEAGIEVVEIPRLEQAGNPVSASRVRDLCAEGRLGSALRLLPETSVPVVLAHEACRALRAELDLTPKPGLVDLNDCGSHTDMDHPLMLRSIEALRPWFARIAAEALKPEPAAHECVAALGIQAEKAMFEATGGVNTHRGALFSLGLTLAAAACLVREGKITPDTLQKSIKTLAAPFKGMQGSHGSEMKRRYGLKGAADMAAEGYQLLFSDWLPFWRRVSRNPNGRHLLLLRVMAKLEDTNLYHRGGQEGAEFARTRALALLQNFSPEGLQQLNTEFIGRNLSPGGSADMFALTLLISSLIS